MAVPHSRYSYRRREDSELSSVSCFRPRILRALDERPRNANQLAEDLALDYKTIRHHLDVLGDNGIVQDSGDDYGAVYLLETVGLAFLLWVTWD